MRKEYRLRRIYQFLAWLVAIVLLLVGGSIYLLIRPQNLLMFNALDKIGFLSCLQTIRSQVHTVELPEFVAYSLPGGLWMASYLLMIYLSTRFYRYKTKLILALPLPIITIIEEFMQLFEWYPGTFDIYDIICYIVPLCIFILSLVTVQQ